MAGLLAAGALQTQVYVTTKSIDEHRKEDVHAGASSRLTALEVTQLNILKELDRANALNAAQTELLNNIYVELARQGAE